MPVTVRITAPTNRAVDAFSNVSVDHADSFQITGDRLYLYQGDQIVSVYNAGAWLGAWLHGDSLPK